MSNQNDFSIHGPKETQNTQKTGKKPYVSPAWEVEEVFERAALGCTKAPGNPACDGGPIVS